MQGLANFVQRNFVVVQKAVHTPHLVFTCHFSRNQCKTTLLALHHMFYDKYTFDKKKGVKHGTTK